jgi:Ser/Thr protein kinase RdoA (MazF antagonist)
VKTLQTFYGIRDATLRQITEATNVVFRVDRPRHAPLVLRLTSPKSCHTPAGIRSEIAWLEALATDTEIGVPAPVRAPHGEYVTTIRDAEIAGEWHCALFHWVPGSMIADRMTESTVGLHGRLAAQLHDHGRTFESPSRNSIRPFDSAFPYSNPAFPPAEPIVLFKRLPKSLMPAVRATVFRRVRERVEHAINSVRAAEPRHIIHNDLHVWNVKASRGTAYALDFEDLLWGTPTQDLSTTLYYYRYRDDHERLLSWFRKGYESVRPWPCEDSQLLETLIIGRMLLLANFVSASEDADDRAFAPEYLERTEKRFRAFLKETR